MAPMTTDIKSLNTWAEIRSATSFQSGSLRKIYESAYNISFAKDFHDRSDLKYECVLYALLFDDN